MKKFSIIGLDTAKDNVISRLMELGAVQIDDAGNRLQDESFEVFGERDGDEDRTVSLDAFASRVNTAVETLEANCDIKKPLFSTRREMGKQEFDKVLENRKKIAADADHVLKLNSRLHDRQEQINKINVNLISLEPWLDYDLPLDMTETRCVRIELGFVPVTVDMENLEKTVAEADEYAVIKEVSRDKDMIYIVIISLKHDEENRRETSKETNKATNKATSKETSKETSGEAGSEPDGSVDISDLLKMWGYTPMPFSEFHGTAKENKERLQQKIKEYEKEAEEIQKEISGCGEMLPDMQCLLDEITMERDRQKVRSSLLRSRRTFYAEGWIPETAVKRVSGMLDEEGCCYEFNDPEEGDEIPVLLETTRFAHPFSAITEMYSLPDPKGFDPTNIFAWFYAFFFGLMLSDAGYGLVMTVVCVIILKKYNLEGTMQKMIKMFAICGVFTMFWGVMFGGYFGDLIQTWASTVAGKTVTISPVWFDPMEDPTRLLIWSLVFGVIHLFTAMGIDMYMKTKRGHVWDAVFDDLIWMFAIVGGACWLAGGSIAPALPRIGMFVFAGSMVVLLFTGGRHNKGFGKVTGGLANIYGITGWISDILSYARLLALGLATGVIASVVNLLGAMAGTGVKGAIALIIVGILGHSFSMAINVLGAFVHSSRLQFVEFFGKFYEDGGEPFRPFARDTKYVKINNDK